jgi:hypothetical protein
MKWLRKFENWTTTSTYDIPTSDVEWDYTSKDKTYYGIHQIWVSRGSSRVKVSAKFDTGARTSSLDFEVARKLGISNDIINKCFELDNLDIPKDISTHEQKKIEKVWTQKLKNEFPEITSVQMVKSSSGFSVRAYIRVKIEYFGNIVETEVNLRDRRGLKAEMLIGLNDMV